MRLATALALTAAALAGAAVPAHAATDFRGVQVSPLRPDSGAINQELDVAKRAKLNLVKADVNWALLEPEPGAYSEEYLDKIDQFTRAAARRKLKVLLLLQTTPCWTDTNPAGACADGRGSNYPPADFEAYGRAAALLAERFGSRLAAIEIWNEPDHSSEQYWKGDNKASDYAALLQATYSKVKDANSRVQVLAGAMVGASGEFLNELYDAGIGGHYDGLSVHYYDLTLASLRSIRFAMTEAGDRKPVWLTEFGYTSCRPAREEEGHECVTRKEQAKFLLDIFKAINKTSWLRAAVVYNLRDTEQYKFGIAREHLQSKPVLKAFAKAFGKRRLGGSRKIKLRESASGVTGTAPVGDVMKLQAFKGSCERQREGASARYEVQDMQLSRGRFNWRISALTRGKWCIYAEHYWTGRKALVDLT
jgi:hypothetical protein